MRDYYQDAEAEVRMYNRQRRERIATAIMAGFARFYSTEQGGPGDTKPTDDRSYETGKLPAHCAVRWADALIAELDEPAETPQDGR